MVDATGLPFFGLFPVFNVFNTQRTAIKAGYSRHCFIIVL